MSPFMTESTRLGERANKMSVAQLEQFVSFIVKRSCRNGADPDHVAAKPKWWPRDLEFSYPVTRAKSMDIAKWRETLLELVARCTCRNRDSILRLTNNPRKNVRAVNHQSGRRKLEKEIKASYENSQQLFHEQDALSVAVPVVSLCDVLQLQPKEKVQETDVSKNDFLNYFNLSDTQHCSVILNNKLYKVSHPLHLLNTQQVPFSSDLGQKMTKECHIVQQEIHQRKIERVERYLTTVINTDTAKPVEYEISFNKHPQYSHTYVFPTKVFRRKERLSSKATFLLMHHCKPCTIEIKNLKLSPANKLVQMKENVPNVLKENKEQKTFQSIQQIVQFPSFKENTPASATSVIQLNNNVADIKKENLVLKTLVPKNENTVLTQKSFAQKLERRNDNLLNASVLLTPINDFFGLRSPKSSANKHVKKRKNLLEKINRVHKRRVLIYHPRRFSLRVLRLKYITNNKS